MTARVLLVLVLLFAPAPVVAADAVFASSIRDAVAHYPAESARLAVGDAFVRFENSPSDRELASRDPALYHDIEVRWLKLAAAMKSGASVGDVRAQGADLAEALDRAMASDPAAGPSSLFLDSVLIIVREGFEAILILAALTAYLVKVGQADKRRLLYAGAGAAVAVSVVLAVVARRVLPMTGTARETLEGVTMLIAVVVLFAASYWLISKAEARRWQAFVRTRLEGALGTGRGGALVLLAFLVVFREGFETVLFYEALGGRTGGSPSGLSAVGSGFAVGVACLAAIAVALFRYGVRIPMRPFFALTGTLLYVLAFKFAGAGVRELQEAGWIPATPAPIPDLTLLRDWLAIYPLVEPLIAQGILVAALLAGGLYAMRATSTLHGAEAARS